METKFLNGKNYIIFQRNYNPIKDLWHFFKNELIIWPRGILIIPIILSVFLIVLFPIAGISWYVLPLITLIFILLQLTLYFLATKFAKTYKTNEIVLGDNNIVFSGDKSGHKEKITYQDIQRLSYSSYMVFTTITEYSLSKLLSFAAFYFRHFVIEYKDITGGRRELLIPLDLVALPEFLHAIVERAGLKKVQPSRLSLYGEWRRLQAGEKFEPLQKQEICPLVIDPNAGIGKLVLVVLIITIIISYFIVKFFM